MTLPLIAYVAGALTILSPCILPVLPFVFARAERPYARSVFPLLIGMVAAFAAVASLAAIGGNWAVQANEIGRYAALALLGVFGLALIFPRIAALLAHPFVSLGSRLTHYAVDREPSIAGSIILGAATGLLWTPCAGPILGLVLTGAALNGANVETTILLAAYAAGAATSLGLGALAGGRILAVLKQSLGIGKGLRPALGVAVLAGVTAIALGVDTGLLARLSYSNTARIEQGLLDNFTPGSRAVAAPIAGPGMSLAASDTRHVAYDSRLPVKGDFPSLDGAVAWLNSEPLTREQLRGKVVLIDFWTYSCINCIRTLPFVRAWADKYQDQGLVVIGVHSPEFAFEKKLENVKQALRNYRITYPVAVDNNFSIWRAFRNNYWPAHYFIDAQGRIRHQHFGEGDYARSERVIQELLSEAAGAKKADTTPVSPEVKGAEVPADFARVESHETYIGYLRAANFASPERIVPDRSNNYTIGKLRRNEWGLAGDWTVGPELASLNAPDGVLSFRFMARDLHLVLGAGADGKPVRFRVSVDGNPPGDDRGADIDPDGLGTISETRLYQLVRQTGDVRERTFEIRFLDPGAQAFVVTFG